MWIPTTPLPKVFMPNPHTTIIAHLTQISSSKSRIEVPTLGIFSKGSAPTNSLCRKILLIDPTLKDHSLEVYREGKLAFTVNSIGTWAEKDLVEEATRGIHIAPHKPFPIAVRAQTSPK